MKNLVLATLLLASASLVAADAKDFSGTLYRRGSNKGELVFTLKAERKPDLWVDHYYDAKGQDAIIERVFLKDGKPVRYEYDDVQEKGLAIMEVVGEKSNLSWAVDGVVKKKTVDTPSNLTFGPLYPVLLQQNFDKLLKGETITGTVPVFTKARVMTAELAFFRRKKLERGDGKVCISMKPANWFVALFFPPIDLYFDEKTQVLQDVHGMSLLKEKVKGEWKMTEVDLYYEYK